MMIRYLTIFAFILFTATFSQAQYFSEGFESGLPDERVNNHATLTALSLSSGTWFAHNVSTPVGDTGVFSYAPGDAPFAAHTGDRYASMNLYNVQFSGHANTFLMSPTRTLNNGDTFTFVTRTVTPSELQYPDRLHLKLSTNGSSTDYLDFTTTLLTINPDLAPGVYPDTDWATFSVTLSGLAGPTNGRFAFNYEVTNAGSSDINGSFIGIDSVFYVPVPEPLSILAVSCLGLVGWRLRRRVQA